MQKNILKTVSTILVSLTMIASVSALELDIAQFSIDDLRSLVKRINTRIVELEKAQTKMCFITSSQLSLGDGEAGVLLEDVRKLQDFLREKGFFQYKSTGYFGKLTRTSLIAYQKSIGVLETGEFDQVTREKVHASSCSSSVLVKKTTQTEEERYKQEVLKKEELKKKELETQYKKEEVKKETYYPKTQVSSISLTQSSTNGIAWVTTGYAQYGYKVTWSKNASPTYPPRDGDRPEYFDANATKASLSAFNGEGTYYVRVCEYLNGVCGAYSNELKIELK